MAPHPAHGSGRLYGVMIGLVSNLDDPGGLGRVQVRLPWMLDAEGKEIVSQWARVAAPMAGPDRGFLIRPEVGDEVLVAFEHGDPAFPFVIGSLWNGKQRPPGPAGAKNDVRVLRSRSGHTIRLDDTEGAEKIEILDGTGQNGLTIDTRAQAMTLSVKGGLNLSCAEDLVLKSTGGEVLIEGKGLKLTSGGGCTVDAKGVVAVKGSEVDLNGGNLVVKK